MEDRKLLKYLRDGDEKGMEFFMTDYGPLIRYVVSPIVKNPQDIEECVSEIAMLVWNKIHTYDESRAVLATWLTALSRNAALNRVRKKQGEGLTEEVSESVKSSLPTPEEALLIKERKRVIISAVNALPKTEKVLFYRKYYYMQPTAQIAAEMGLTERAVEGRLYRIKGKLRTKLGGEINE